MVLFIQVPWELRGIFIEAHNDRGHKPEDLYRKALKKWGILAQILMFFEETAELQKAICKKERGKGTQIAIIEELADVEIMLEQMKVVYDRGGDVFRQVKRRKLERLSNMLED